MNEELVLRIQSGEDLYAELWERVRRFVRKQAKAYIRYFPDSIIDLDDLVQGGYLALVDAVGAYDPAGGTFLSLLMFYLKRVWREMYGLRGRREVLDNAVSLDEPIDDDGDATRLDLLPDDRAEQAFVDVEDDVYRDQLRAALEKALDAAPHGDVVRRRYFQGQTGKEIASELGVSVSRVGQCESECKRYLRHGPYTRELQQFLDANTNFYMQVGPDSFNRTHTSAVETLVLRREDLEKHWRKKAK